MNIKIYFTICFLSLLSWALCAQEGSVGIGTINPHNSALLDLFSSKKGLLVPRVQLVAFDNRTSPVSGPADGLLIFHIGGNDIEKGFYYWDGHAWVGLCSCPLASLGVQITPSDTAICFGNNVTLHSTVTMGSGPYHYEWKEGESVVGSEASYTPPQPLSEGEHTYTLTVFDGDLSASAEATVTVNSLPIVEVSGEGTYCKDSAVELGAGVGSHYSWTGPDGFTANVADSIPHATSPGTYSVTVTDDNGCTGTASVDISVRDLLGQATTFTVGTGDNTVSFKMIPVPGGEFLMGAQASGLNADSEAEDDEKPVHRVKLNTYAIGETEVTQALWEAVYGSWPGVSSDPVSVPIEEYGLGDNYPAYYVSYNDITAENIGFLAKLNAQFAGELCGMEFALPTEAQWEYAAAGGSAGYNENGTRKHKYSGSDNADDVAWHRGNADGKSHEVGASCTEPNCKQSNQLGLYDMSGNVCEWCSDWLGTYSETTNPVEADPNGPNSGDSRVVRGGSYGDAGTKNVRVANREGYDPGERSFAQLVGFRLVLVKKDEAAEN